MTKPTIDTQDLQRRIGHRAKSAPEHRFWGLYVHLAQPSTLEAAYLEAKRKGGAPGSDGETFNAIEERGREEFLSELAAEVRGGTYRPRPYRRREIPKEGGKVRVISIPTIRDRVVHGALKLLLEPIFEADFSRHSYGARPGRSAHDAIGEVRSRLMWKKHLVVDVDLKSFFDDIGHAPLLAKIARRVQDDRVLGLIKQFLKSTGKKGIPQGSPLSPLRTAEGPGTVVLVLSVGCVALPSPNVAESGAGHTRANRPSPSSDPPEDHARSSYRHPRP